MPLISMFCRYFFPPETQLGGQPQADRLLEERYNDIKKYLHTICKVLTAPPKYLKEEDVSKPPECEVLEATPGQQFCVPFMNNFYQTTVEEVEELAVFLAHKQVTVAQLKKISSDNKIFAMLFMNHQSPRQGFDTYRLSIIKRYNPEFCAMGGPDGLG